MLHINRRHQAFTMVETLVALAILSLFFTAVVLILQQILDNLGHARVRATALALTQSKMEEIRNLPYADVGTIGGIPQGTIPQTETVTINGQDFTVLTSVIYLDDPFDGVAPADLLNTDYKRARVEVSWTGAYPSREPVTQVTNIAPRGVETVAGGGTLIIQVFDSQAAPVSNATIQIDNTAVTPAIHTQTLSDTNGQVILPGAPACVTCYEVRVSKSGNSSARTYSTSEVTNPLQPHATVIEGQITQLSFAIDRTSTLGVNAFGSRETNYPPVGSVLFTIRGSKIIGYDSNDEPVYKYENATGTIGNTLTVSGLEWDVYTLDFTNSGHVLGGSNPLQPIALNPGTSVTTNIVAIPKGNYSLLVTIKNAAEQPQENAQIELSTSNPSYIATKSAGALTAPDFGQALFNSLSQNTYDLRITAPGFDEATGSVTLTGNQQETYILNQSQ